MLTPSMLAETACKGLAALIVDVTVLVGAPLSMIFVKLVVAAS